MKEGGYTLIPLSLYFSDGKAKVELALALEPLALALDLRASELSAQSPTIPALRSSRNGANRSSPSMRAV